MSHQHHINSILENRSHLNGRQSMQAIMNYAR